MCHLFPATGSSPSPGRCQPLARCGDADPKIRPGTIGKPLAQRIAVLFAVSKRGQDAPRLTGPLPWELAVGTAPGSCSPGHSSPVGLWQRASQGWQLSWRSPHASWAAGLGDLCQQQSSVSELPRHTTRPGMGMRQGGQRLAGTAALRADGGTVMAWAGG